MTPCTAGDPVTRSVAHPRGGTHPAGRVGCVSVPASAAGKRKDDSGKRFWEKIQGNDSGTNVSGNDFGTNDSGKRLRETVLGNDSDTRFW